MVWLRRRAVAVSRALLCVALLALHGVRTGRAQADGASDGECACACEHCGADDDSEHATLPASDSDRDTSSGGGRPPDTVEQPDGSDSELNLSSDGDSDSNTHGGSDSARRLLQKAEEELMWALGSDGGASDESDSNRGSDRHVDLSSDRASDSEARASDGSDSDSDAMEVPECLAACAALAPLWSLEVGETHGRAAVAAALLLVTAGCDAARSEGAARCVDSCGEEERAVAAAGLSEVAEEVCGIVTMAEAALALSSSDSEQQPQSDSDSVPQCVSSCEALSPVLTLLELPAASLSFPFLVAACTALRSPAADECLTACSEEVLAVAAELDRQVCDVNVTAAVDPCGCDCACGPLYSPIVVDWANTDTTSNSDTTSATNTTSDTDTTSDTTSDSDILLNSTAPTAAPTAAPSLSPEPPTSTATQPPTATPTTSPTGALSTSTPSSSPTATPTTTPTGSPSVVTGAPTETVVVPPTAAPTVTQDTVVRATVTLADLDFAQFADAAFNVSFRVNFTMDVAAAAQVDEGSVTILSISAGSTVVQTSVRFRGGVGADSFETALQTDPSSLLANTSLSQYGAVTVSDVRSSRVAPLPATASPTPAPVAPPPPAAPTLPPSSPHEIIKGLSLLQFWLAVAGAGVLVIILGCVCCCRMQYPLGVRPAAYAASSPVAVPADRAPRSVAAAAAAEGDEWDPAPRLDLRAERGPMRSIFAHALLGQAAAAGGGPLPPDKLRETWFDIQSV